MAHQAHKMMRRDTEVDPTPTPRREILSIREALDEMGVARCPLCRVVLVARMGRAGPRFYCRCPKKRAA